MWKWRKLRCFLLCLYIMLLLEIYWKVKECWDNVSCVVVSLFEVVLFEDLMVEEVVMVVMFIRSGVLVVNLFLGVGVVEFG